MSADTLLKYLHRSTRLIPFYSHRCFFDGMDHMPIVSFWQPTDSILTEKALKIIWKSNF